MWFFREWSFRKICFVSKKNWFNLAKICLFCIYFCLRLWTNNCALFFAKEFNSKSHFFGSWRRKHIFLSYLFGFEFVWFIRRFFCWFHRLEEFLRPLFLRWSLSKNRLHAFNLIDLQSLCLKRHSFEKILERYCLVWKRLFTEN